MIDLSKTLFVCTGNVFRSVISEKFFNRGALENNLPFQARSRGTNIHFKRPNPLLGRIVEEDYSISLKNHQARKISEGDVSWASSIVCFTPEHREEMAKKFPEAKDKIFLIYDISHLDPSLFKDIDYYDVSRMNGFLAEELKALKSAVDGMYHRLSVSVIMAVYNEEKNVANILNKLVGQSAGWAVREIIVVSSGSTDGTDETIRSVESPLIKLIRERTRKGKISAIKKAIPFANGSNVLLIDGDVEIEDDFIERCFSCVCGGMVPCTAKIVPIPAKKRFFHRLSEISCEAWNSLRKKNSKAGAFVYPSGYGMLIGKEDLEVGFEEMEETAINDDGLLSFVLFKKGVLFRYCDDLRVRVVFPQSLRDFFAQKIRTRMGRRQGNADFFKSVEKQWRKEIFATVNADNLFLVSILLVLDALARFLANVKIRFNLDHHLWKPVRTTKRP
jgi:glycosyltransferase involved in cell wall biosynthesis/predicted protein tyrosine phosphatase